MTAPTPESVERFREVLARRFGLHFEEFKLNLVVDVLERRSGEQAMTPARYVASLEGANGSKEWRELARELTVGETYFFRNIEQFHALREAVLPARIRARGPVRRLSLASIGCSSGEEPYTMAMVLRQSLPPASGWSVSITAVDVNPDAIEKARSGRYSEWSLRGTPAEMRDRWFRREGRSLVVDENVRRMVTFEERNVVADQSFWSNSSFDVVFCRNMLMYLAPGMAQGVVARIAGALLPGGFFFLGHAETLRGLSREFHLRHTHDTFYYQKRLENEPVTEAVPEWNAPSVPLAEIFDSADSWVDTISRSAERIRSLTEGRVHSGTPPGATPAGRFDLAPAFALLRDERYEEALALLEGLPAAASRNSDVLVLRAVLLAHRGRLTEAESVCRELLAVDELSAGAHYLMALCREGARDREGAIDHDQTAAYLDPTFAAPRLHLGLLARKSGDRGTARRDLTQALMLLEREDTSRLLLFGGGFSRQALIDLCRAELLACGGTA